MGNEIKTDCDFTLKCNSKIVSNNAKKSMMNCEKYTLYYEKEF